MGRDRLCLIARQIPSFAVAVGPMIDEGNIQKTLTHDHVPNSVETILIM